ncbi:MAG: methyltransferase domain-containing protein, partial [Solirubrobacteraceae bacterium]
MNVRPARAERMPVSEQVSQGRLVCPTTHRRLRIDNQRLLSDAGTSYQLHGGVPIMLEDGERANAYIETRPAMLREYQLVGGEPPRPRQLLPRMKTRLLALGNRGIGVLSHNRRDYRTACSERAARLVLDRAPPDSLCVSIGGGPGRDHPKLVNLNIGPFPNVEVVADAHRLPYADGSVDAIHCEAVLEHLVDPRLAVTEMFRVCRPGAAVYAAPPVMP